MSSNLYFVGGSAEKETALPFTREHNFQGFGGSGFGPDRHPFPNLCQGPPKTTPNTKNSKNQPPKWYPLPCRWCPGIAPWALGFRRWIQNSFFMCPAGYLRSIKTAPKWSQNDKKYHQYSPINIETDTVLTTLWTPAQTNLRMPLHEFIQRPRAAKRFLWAAG